MYRENVQVYIYSIKDDRLLLLKRTEERSGYWQPVCGGIETGESFIATGIREVNEETGITEWSELIEIPNTYEYKEIKNDVELEMKDYCTFMTINEIVDVKLSDEHVKYVWCKLDEVKNFTDWEPITESIQWIKKTLMTREIHPITR